MGFRNGPIDLFYREAVVVSGPATPNLLFYENDLSSDSPRRGHNTATVSLGDS